MTSFALEQFIYVVQSVEQFALAYVVHDEWVFRYNELC